MIYREVRMSITPELYREYKIICVKYDLSMPKQTAKLIKGFVEMHKEMERNSEQCKPVLHQEKYDKI